MLPLSKLWNMERFLKLVTKQLEWKQRISLKALTMANDVKIVEKQDIKIILTLITQFRT